MLQAARLCTRPLKDCTILASDVFQGRGITQFCQKVRRQILSEMKVILT